jgi:hypothetical protein
MEQKVPFIIPLCIIFSLLYIVLAIRPLGTEYQFIPAWTTKAVPSAAQTPSSGAVTDDSVPAVSLPQSSANTEKSIRAAAYAGVIPFRLGQTLGYFTPEGGILRVVTFPYKAAISSSCYATFGTNDPTIPFYDPSGTLSGTIAKNGFPYFAGEKMYLFLPGGNSFSQLSDDGSVMWTYEGYAPITAFDSAKSGCVAGLADGTLISFTPDGKTDQNFIPGGSDYPVILGTAISESGTYIAAVTGQDEQRFVIAKKEGSYSTIIYHEYLEKALTNQVLVQFSDDEKTVYFNCADGLGVVSVKSGKHRHIALNGRILSIKESAKNKLVFILSKSGSTYTVSMLESMDCIAGSFSFDSPSAFITTKDGALFVGRDDEISRINVVRK